MVDRPKILLIGPTAIDFYGKPIKQRKLHLPGLTLNMLASVTPSNFSFKLISETVENIPYEEHWDLVGLTGMGSGLWRAWEIADKFRNHNCKVVIGGIAASLADPDLTLQHADALVIGEAEEIWPKLLKDFENNQLEKIYRMEKRPDITNLPLPRYDLFNKKKLGYWRPVQATRGCPFTCNFCSITSFFEQGYRKRPVDQVIRDVRVAKKHGTKFIVFLDDNIGVDFNYCEELWEALIPEKVIWMSQCSLQISEHPKLLKLAYRSGCRLLSFGIESVSRESLKSVDKEWNHPERYTERIEAIRNHGIDISTEMIIGLDGDDSTVFDNTFEFIMKNKITVPRIHILTPVPGTPLFKKMLREDRLIDLEFKSFSGGKVVFKPLNFDNEELQAGYWKLYKRLFSSVSIFKRLIKNHARLNLDMRAFILGTNLHYRNHIYHKITPGIV